MGDSDEWAREVAELKVIIRHQEETIRQLTKEKLEVEKLKDDLDSELTAAQNAADDAEGERDQRTHEMEVAVEDLREARRTMLEFLRKIEFDPMGDCLLCFFDWEAARYKKPSHTVDCELKLLIFKLDMDLNKPPYAMA